tara:strand:+ start:167 stop:487 length:321 start_codon:yes stop_codon:yes gene_type:complete
MAINPDVDIPLALEKLGVKWDEINLSQSVPPHTIVSWVKGEFDDQPTDDEINAAWIAYKNEDLYKEQRKDEYPTWETQLDYIYHNGIDKWKTDIVDPVKNKYPKPS